MPIFHSPCGRVCLFLPVPWLAAVHRHVFPSAPVPMCRCVHLWACACCALRIYIMLAIFRLVISKLFMSAGAATFIRQHCAHR
jgi:hypothetical protein